MSTLPRPLPPVLGLVAAGTLALAAFSARSAPPPPSGTAPSAAPSAQAGEAAGPLRGADIPEETSDVPKTKEWETARAVVATQEQKVCTFKVLREWLRVECLRRIGASQVAGDPADVKIWGWGQVVSDLPWRKAATVNDVPRVIFTTRLRRGDAKIFELLELGWTYEGYTWAEPAERLSVAWRPGRPDPVLLVQRVR